MEKKPKHKPLKFLSKSFKIFNKSKRASPNQDDSASTSDNKPVIKTNPPLGPTGHESPPPAPNMLSPGSHGDNISLSTHHGVPLETVEQELEALHISRQDNPYLQLISSQDGLDDECSDPDIGGGSGTGGTGSGSQSLFSPEPPCSPTRSFGPMSLSEIHSHLVRSPPPVTWQSRERDFLLSPRSNGTFSPDSSDGMDMENSYNRCQSEEHILSPCRDLLRSGMFSPMRRGITPDFSNEMSPRIIGPVRRGYRSQHSYNGEDSLSPTRNTYEDGATYLPTGITCRSRGRSPVCPQTPSYPYWGRSQSIVTPSAGSASHGDTKSMENLYEGGKVPRGSMVMTSSVYLQSPYARKSVTSLGDTTSSYLLMSASPQGGRSRIKKSLSLRPKKGALYIDDV